MVDGVSDLGPCNVCDKEPAVVVACSQLGAISFAYGRTCLDAHAEPYSLLVDTVVECGGRQHTAKWVDAVIESTLRISGKTLEELDADVADLVLAFDAATTHRVVEGVGFGAMGEDSNYLFFIGGDGKVSTVQATHLVPMHARADWAHLEALVGGFGQESSLEKLTSRYAEERKPQAYRLRITVDAEPLTEAETEALLERARAYNAARDKE